MPEPSLQRLWVMPEHVAELVRTGGDGVVWRDGSWWVDPASTDPAHRRLRRMFGTDSARERFEAARAAALVAGAPFDPAPPAASAPAPRAEPRAESRVEVSPASPVEGPVGTPVSATADPATPPAMARPAQTSAGPATDAGGVARTETGVPGPMADRRAVARAANAEMLRQGLRPVREVAAAEPVGERVYLFSVREADSPLHYGRLDAEARAIGVRLEIDRDPRSERVGLRYLVAPPGTDPERVVPAQLARFRTEEAFRAHLESRRRRDESRAMIRGVAGSEVTLAEGRAARRDAAAPVAARPVGEGAPVAARPAGEGAPVAARPVGEGSPVAARPAGESLPVRPFWPLLMPHPERNPQGFEKKAQELRQIGSAKLKQILDVTEAARREILAEEDRLIVQGKELPPMIKGRFGALSRGAKMIGHILKERSARGAAWEAGQIRARALAEDAERG